MAHQTVVRVRYSTGRELNGIATAIPGSELWMSAGKYGRQRDLE